MTFGALILANDGFAHKARIASVLPFGMLGAHVRCTDGTVWGVGIASSASACGGACAACAEYASEDAKAEVLP